MKRIDILKTLNDIFNDVLDLDDIQLSELTSPKDLEEWDSLSHIQLVVAIEKEFKIKFKSSEIISWKNVGSIVNSIQEQI